MKKAFLFLATATIVVLSCQKEIEQEPTQQQEAKFAFKASIEDFASSTKAEMNSSYQLVWKESDKIGVFVNDNDWIIKNQPFTLVGSGETTTGSFSWDANDGDFTNIYAAAAFFPWDGQYIPYSFDQYTQDTNHSNVSTDGKVYFHLRPSYDNYSSGKMLTPLVAKITRTGDAYNPIQFKHAGAAVKLVIPNLPAYATSASMTAGVRIAGWYNFALANLDEETIPALAENDGESSEGNTVTLNYATNTTGEFTFIFPTPALTTPKLAFAIKDKNGVTVWSKSLKAQSENLGRKDILSLTAPEITPFSEFDQISPWGICGTHTSWADNSDTPMVTEVDGNIHIANNIAFAANAEFKIRKDGQWNDKYDWYNVDESGSVSGLLEDAGGTDHNIKVKTAGTYDIILNTETHKIKVVASDVPYPDAAGMPHHTSIKKAKDLSEDGGTANCYIIKAAGKYKIPGVQGNSSTTVGTIAGVELLWETYNNATSVTPNSVIADVDYDATDNYVYFKTPSTLQPGNALIAAKDANGDIIWSWHIWIPATAITDIGDYSVSKKYLMDRNLGAVVPAVIPAGEGTVDVRSVGLFYQWGRKDPFVGYKWGKTRIDIQVSGGYRILSGTKVTIEESISAPTTMIQGQSDARDWLKTEDNTLWGHGTGKTIYDPCPAGYRVPDRDSKDPLWQDVTALSQFSTSDYSTGHWWKLGNVVFPHTGYYYYSSGNIDGEYNKSYLWAAEAHPTAGYGQAQYVEDENNDGTWASHPGWGLGKSSAAPIRCVRIEGEVPPPPVVGANGVTLATNGSISSDWSKAELVTDSNGGGIQQWKYGYDTDNLYFYFKIKRSSIKSEKDALSFRKRRYIWIGLDTDNDSTKGVAPGHDLTITGCEARALVYPFTGTATAMDSTAGELEIINGLDDRSQTEVLVGTTSTTEDNIYVYGNVTGDTSSDFAYIEMSIPKSGLGISSSFTGIMKVQFTLSGDTTESARIEIK